ncbi:MAG: class I SAM-dependent DNA methyltransferase [Sedimentibacter saalensis]|jgi:type I restriction enzyme M protein|uniref:type I restriction-modification system subunit M n=1 Tax=Sedimentibacter saalensis TaxID=130788 RepID=UPI002B21EF6A|nr:class I SAM-dependent DNA methyltransferase [Sedimentibacter saalensis]MEA5096238.1 class I SAM-dependent DNA methyltransferase [Sedimentibacter saalensis]
MINIRKLEAELWTSADLLRQGSKLTSQEYCMPVLGLIFLRYAYGRFKLVEADILNDRPMRGGRVLPVEANDFKMKSALFLPEKARYEYLLNLPDDTDVGKAVNEAMELIEQQSQQLVGVLPKTYTAFKNELLRELIRIFNNKTLDEVGGDVVGRIYEYFLSKFAPAVASDDGVFFTPKSLVQMIVNIIEPKHGILLDPACGSGGMFVQTGDFVSANGTNANTAMTFYGQEKVDYNAKLCLMNMAVHGLNGNIKSGDDANTFYNDAHNLVGQCDYVMANPPFNVDLVNAENAQNAGRLSLGLPGINKDKVFSNANYLWINYFYSYLKENGRAGFVMAASATDSGNKDRDIRENLVKTGHVDVMLSVGNNFFYTKSLPCSLWFFDKGKPENLKGTVLFIDTRNYYTVVDRTLNEWSEWQMKNINAIVWLYRGENEKYKMLISEYKIAIINSIIELDNYLKQTIKDLGRFSEPLETIRQKIASMAGQSSSLEELFELRPLLKECVALILAQQKELLTYADSLEKSSAKTLAESQGYSTWQQYKKQLSILVDQVTGSIKDDQLSIDCNIKNIRQIIKEAHWLTEKFGEGNYTDVLGLCKSAIISEIEEKNWSLTPGAYVGVAPVIDDNEENFTERMVEIHNELLTLHAEANDLMDTITSNFEGLGI